MTEKKEIKLVIFDIGKVLIGFDLDPLFVLLQKNQVQTKTGNKGVEKIFFESGILDSFHKGEVDVEGFYQKICQLGKIEDVSLSEFKKAFLDIFFDNEGIEEIVKKIAGDYKVMLISDVSSFHWDNKLKDYYLIKKYFPEKWQRVLSFEEKIAKPSPEIFQEAFSRAAVSPQKAIFIDDIKENCQGFEKIGGRGIHYNCRLHSIQDLKNRLKKAGVKG